MLWKERLWTLAHLLLIELLISRMQNQVGWRVLFSSYRTLASTMCVCVHACFHIVLHVFGVSGILFTQLEHMLA